jgi:hypothetical protein
MLEKRPAVRIKFWDSVHLRRPTFPRSRAVRRTRSVWGLLDPRTYPPRSADGAWENAERGRIYQCGRLGCGRSLP